MEAKPSDLAGDRPLLRGDLRKACLAGLCLIPHSAPVLVDLAKRVVELSAIDRCHGTLLCNGNEIVSRLGGTGNEFMKIFLSTLLLALAIGSPVGQARAVEWPSPQHLSSSNTYERLGAWRQVWHLFSVERLSPESFTGYAAALAEGDCDLALSIVWNTLVEREPAFAARAKSSEVARAWRRSVLPYRFPEHVFCEERRHYLLLAPRLAKRGIRSLPETAILGHAERRNTDVMPSYQALLIDTLQVLFNVAHSDNPDAIRFILEQDRVGRFVRLTDEQRLSLLVRLVRLGEAGRDERARAMKLAQEAPLSTVAAARAYAAREVEPEFERWQAYQGRLRELSANAPPPGSP